MRRELATIRERIDRLAAEPAAPPKLADRAARLVGDGAEPGVEELLAVDAGLDKAGVHTLADARLLARLAADGARAGSAAEGLRRRAHKALQQLDRLLAWHERQKRMTGRPSATRVAVLEGHYLRLVRAVKVAEVLAAPAAPRDDLFELLPRVPLHKAPPTDAKIAAAEFLLGRARASPHDVRRKRRDLDTAYEILLQLDGAKDHARAHAVRAHVARARTELNGVAGAPAGTLGTVERLQQAVSDREGAPVWNAAVDLYRGALEAGDRGLAQASRRVLEALVPHLPGGVARAVDGDGGGRLLESMGRDGVVADFLSRQYEGDTRPAQRDALAALAFDLEQDKWLTFELSVGAFGFFDVESTLEAIEEEEPDPDVRYERVPYPTPDLTLDVARGIEELPNFVISDPRMMLYDLANDRQLTRAWLAPDRPPTRKKRRGAVRVYVCDASGSMAGARARFRDALLIAELNNLSVRLARRLPAPPIYYTFFTDFPTDLTRVDSTEKAMAVVERLFAESPAAGRTDITYALESAFAAVRDARGRDPELSRATVVLVTDGEDHVDLERIRAARQPVGEVELTLNFVSLGEENRDLRRLVDEQRAAGRRAFYYRMTDAELTTVRSDFDSGPRTLLPRRPELEVLPDAPEVQAAVEALLAVAAEEPMEASAQRAAASRFGGLFPALSDAVVEAPAAEAVQLTDILSAVAATVAMAPSDARAGEAVVLVEHLLSVYALKVPTYLKLLPLLGREGRELLGRIRLLAAPGAELEASAG